MKKSPISDRIRRMVAPGRIDYGRFTVYSYDRPADAPAIIEQIMQGGMIRDKGRGGIKVVSIDGIRMACRQYIHGGLLRAVTGDRFCSEKRAVDEANILSYLEEAGFPAVHPCYVVVERKGIANTLYLLTGFVEDSTDLLEVWRQASGRARFRVIKRLAGLIRRLELLGVYHRDLHISNVLVAGGGDLIFLDFDRAYRKEMTANDMERIFWRLNRYMEKQKGKGKITLDIREKIFFLRVYQKLSGYDILSHMTRRLRLKGLFDRTGWLVESFLYGGKQ